MNTEDIIKFENNAGNELHLFRDRLFWQAWERSAFLFSKIFRKERLLTIHPHKIQLQPAAFGFDFLGVHILPYRVYPGTRVLKNCKKAVVNPDNDQAKQESIINSYEGMFKHLNGTRKIHKFIADSRKPQ